MRNENLEQDLGWAPTQYPAYNSFEDGEWRIVEDDGKLVGIIYTNRTTSAGIVWLNQTDTVMAIRKMFLVGAETGMTPSAAYAAVESRYAQNLRNTLSGTMDGVNTTFAELMHGG